MDGGTLFMRYLKIDTGKPAGRNPGSYNLCVGGGRAYETLLRENQRHLQLVRDACGFRYLRFHGLLHDDMAVYQEDAEGNPYYNFQYIDLLIDAMLKIGVRPFVELGFMPGKLASGTKTVFFWRGNVTMPKRLESWTALVRALAAHFVQRYGEQEVAQWFFEVWNEPNLDIFFACEDPFGSYMKLYRAAADGVRAASPRLRVGGPATAGCAWISEFIDACAQDGLPLDFISTHAYGVEGFVDEFGRSVQRLIAREDSVSGDMLRVRAQIDASPRPGLPLYFTEWSSSYSPRDNVHDSYHEAAFVLTRVHDAFRSVDGMSYWTFSDIFEEGGPGPSPFHGGFGLLNVKGLKKPAFFAFHFLNLLGDALLACGDPHALCTCGPDGLQALFWDYTIPDQKDVPDQRYFTRDLPPAPAEEVCLQADGLAPGRYLLEVFGVGYRMNDIYSAYLSLGAPQETTPAQEALLRASCAGEPLIRRTVEVDGRFVFEQKMRENDVYFLRLSPI